MKVTKKEQIFHQKKMIGKNLRKIIEQLLLMFCMLKKKKMYTAYVSKFSSNCENQVFLLMIPNGEGQHYLAVKQLSASLRILTSKHQGDFYGLNYLHSFAIENKCESHKKV